METRYQSNVNVKRQEIRRGYVSPSEMKNGGGARDGKGMTSGHGQTTRGEASSNSRFVSTKGPQGKSEVQSGAEAGRSGGAHPPTDSQKSGSNTTNPAPNTKDPGASPPVSSTNGGNGKDVPSHAGANDASGNAHPPPSYNQATDVSSKDEKPESVKTSDGDGNQSEANDSATNAKPEEKDKAKTPLKLGEHLRKLVMEKQSHDFLYHDTLPPAIMEVKVETGKEHLVTNDDDIVNNADNDAESNQESRVPMNPRAFDDTNSPVEDLPFFVDNLDEDVAETGKNQDGSAGEDQADPNEIPTVVPPPASPSPKDSATPKRDESNDNENRQHIEDKSYFEEEEYVDDLSDHESEAEEEGKSLQKPREQGRGDDMEGLSLEERLRRLEGLDAPNSTSVGTEDRNVAHGDDKAEIDEGGTVNHSNTDEFDAETEFAKYMASSDEEGGDNDQSDKHVKGQEPSDDTVHEHLGPNEDDSNPEEQDQSDELDDFEFERAKQLALAKLDEELDGKQKPSETSYFLGLNDHEQHAKYDMEFEKAKRLSALEMLDQELDGNLAEDGMDAGKASGNFISGEDFIHQLEEIQPPEQSSNDDKQNNEDHGTEYQSPPTPPGKVQARFETAPRQNPRPPPPRPSLPPQPPKRENRNNRQDLFSLFEGVLKALEKVPDGTSVVREWGTRKTPLLEPKLHPRKRSALYGPLLATTADLQSKGAQNDKAAAAELRLQRLRKKAVDDQLIEAQRRNLVGMIASDERLAKEMAVTIQLARLGKIDRLQTPVEAVGFAIARLGWEALFAAFDVDSERPESQHESKADMHFNHVLGKQMEKTASVNGELVRQYLNVVLHGLPASSELKNLVKNIPRQDPALSQTSYADCQYCCGKLILAFRRVLFFLHYQVFNKVVVGVDKGEYEGLILALMRDIREFMRTMERVILWKYPILAKCKLRPVLGDKNKGTIQDSRRGGDVMDTNSPTIIIQSCIEDALIDPILDSLYIAYIPSTGEQDRAILDFTTQLSHLPHHELMEKLKVREFLWLEARELPAHRIPYIRTVEILQNTWVMARTPSSKLKSTNDACELIRQSVRDHYARPLYAKRKDGTLVVKREPITDPNMLVVSDRDLLAVFMFAMIHSHPINLSTQCAVIRDLLTSLHIFDAGNTRAHRAMGLLETARAALLRKQLN